ncbi:MAG: TetR/AcrR family transcriptional regulator [Gammaproteobacteria bacterium]|nr:TetR/AcrR family transcriptional regulator [Gammaproteobacteria bacterium]
MPKTTRAPYHHGFLKESFVEAAIEYLEKNGVARLSLREVAAAIGVSHNAPYRHFKGKDALLEAMAVIGYQKIEAICHQAAQDYPRDPIQQLVEAGTRYVLHAIKHPELHNLLFGANIKSSASSVELKQAAHKAVMALVRIIENGQAASLYQDRPAEQMALASLSAVHGLSQFALAGHLKDSVLTTKEVRSYCANVADMVLHGLLKRK